MKKVDQNQIIIVGKLSSSHKVFTNYGGKMVETYIETARVCKTKTEIDRFVVNMPFGLYDAIDRDPLSWDEEVKIKLIGEVRTYMINDENDVPHLKVIIFAKEAKLVRNEKDKCEMNIEGNICKTKEKRITPFGRTICDFIIACNYSPYKTAYIPSICWEKLANQIEAQEVGSHIWAKGCLHSRLYIKLVNGIEESRIAYEFSVNDYSLLKGE